MNAIRGGSQTAEKRSRLADWQRSRAWMEVTQGGEEGLCGIMWGCGREECLGHGGLSKKSSMK